MTSGSLGKKIGNFRRRILDLVRRLRRLRGIERHLSLGHAAENLHGVLLGIHQVHALLDDARRTLMGEGDRCEDQNAPCGHLS